MIGTTQNANSHLTSLFPNCLQNCIEFVTFQSGEPFNVLESCILSP